MLFGRRPAWISEPAWRRLMLGRDAWKQARRQVRRAFLNPRYAVAYAGLRRAVRAADWPAARDRALVVAALAETARDEATVYEMVHVLQRLGGYAEGKRLWSDQLRRVGRFRPNEWRGEDLSGRTVAIDFNDTDRQGLSVAYQCAGLVRHVAERAGETILVVEPRLVATFRRSFPDLRVVAALDAVGGRAIDFVALPAFLLATFGATEFSAARPATVLADRGRAASLRRDYRERRPDLADRPLVGLCWASSSHAKLLPPLPAWAGFVARADAGFVSLQYGKIDRDLELLGRGRVIVDDTIDQMRDMDGFAAEVAALDGVITIVNTLAHVAGALGVPTVVVRDDLLRREWPVMSDRAPWYANVRVVGPDGRDWDAVLDAAWAKLQELWAERDRSG